MAKARANRCTCLLTIVALARGWRARALQISQLLWPDGAQNHTLWHNFRLLLLLLHCYFEQHRVRCMSQARARAQSIARVLARESIKSTLRSIELGAIVVLPRQAEVRRRDAQTELELINHIETARAQPVVAFCVRFDYAIARKPARLRGARPITRLANL